MNQELTATNWDELLATVADGLTALAETAEIADGGRARTLFFALAGYLDERGIIDYLAAAAAYLQGASAAKDAPPVTIH